MTGKDGLKNITIDEQNSILDFVQQICDLYQYPKIAYLIRTETPDRWLAINTCPELEQYDLRHSDLTPGTIIDDLRSLIPAKYDVIVIERWWCESQNRVVTDQWRPSRHRIDLPIKGESKIKSPVINEFDANRITWYCPNPRPDLAPYLSFAMTINGIEMSRLKQAIDGNGTSAIEDLMEAIYNDGSNFFWSGDDPLGTALAMIADPSWRVHYELPHEPLGLRITIRDPQYKHLWEENKSHHRFDVK